MTAIEIIIGVGLMCALAYGISYVQERDRRKVTKARQQQYPGSRDWTARYMK